MNRLNVLQIGKYYHPYSGGTENHLLTLSRELQKKVNVQVLSANTEFKTSLEKDEGIAIVRLASLGNFFSVPLTLNLPFWLKRQNADILHFHLPNPLSVLAYFLIRPKGRVIVSYHSDIIRQRFFNPLFNFLLKRFLKRAERIIVASENLICSSRILKKFKNKCNVIPYGIDIDRFKISSIVMENVSSIKQKYAGPLVLFVGRLVYYKGLEYLFSAMKDIQAKLLIAGSGPLRNKLNRLAKRLKIEEKIVWLGKVKNESLSSYYHSCDVFVLPSSLKAESFGIVQLEAFACAKPVVSTNLPTGVPFVNLDKKTGLIVEPGNHSELKKAINILLNSPDLCKIYGQNGRERLGQEFNKEKMAAAVLKIYEAVERNEERNYCR